MEACRMSSQQAFPSQLAGPTVRILGSRVHLLSAERAVDSIEQWVGLGDGRCRQVVVTGFHGLMEAFQKPRVHDVLNSADLWVPDGIAPVWVARLRGHKQAVRATGTEIMLEWFRRAEAHGLSSYFYGDTQQTLDALVATVTRDYPRHKVAGAFSPPYHALTPEEDTEIIARINAARPDVLWIALGLPKQDIWIHDRIARLQVPVAAGVGAAFAFVGGTVDRCPRWMGDAGFEWVYRFWKEPRKLWRRDLLDGPRFLFHAGLELLRGEAHADRS
jgi:N-acetylglucosaminyldiphosphoundecaprenol N-acetyl-beta-D-mannosaminyltransferase